MLTNCAFVLHVLWALMAEINGANVVGLDTNIRKQALVSGLPRTLMVMPFGEPCVVDPRLFHAQVEVLCFDVQ